MMVDLTHTPAPVHTFDAGIYTGLLIENILFLIEVIFHPASHQKCLNKAFDF